MVVKPNLAPYATFLCTKFQGNQITFLHFMTTSHVEGKKGKQEKLSQFLKVHILKCLAQFS